MIPANEWWAVLQHYNETIFPAQIALYLLAAGVVGIFIWKPGEIASRLAKGFFALAFGWIGLVFFLALGRELPAHNAQAFLFLSLAGLFSLDLVTNTSLFRMPDGGWRKIATLTGFGLALAYPLVGLLMGRPFSGWIIPGAFPCPTTALALVFMATTNSPRKRRWLYLATIGLLLLWAIPFPILIQIPQFGAYEDGIMVVLGVYALVSWLLRGRGAKSSL
jgi:hypothetical protein